MISMLVGIGTLGWLVGYLGAVWVGFRHKTYGVPLLAVAFNFSYEIVLAWFFLVEKVSFFRTMFAAWAIVDLGVMLTILLYAHHDKTLNLKRWQVYLIVLPSFVIFGLFHWWCASVYGPKDAAFYPAYVENILMSFLFIGLAIRRHGSYGQSFILAWGKFIGTAGMTVLYGIIFGRSYALICGSFVFVLDIVYLYFMYRGPWCVRAGHTESEQHQ